MLQSVPKLLKIAATDTRYGRMAYYADDQYVGYCLERYGEYSEAEPALWRKLVKPGDTVLDVGANIGALTLPLSEMVGPTGRVFAFEPHPQNFMLLRQNCADHPNIRVWDVALGADVGDASFPRLNDLQHTNYGGIELELELERFVSSRANYPVEVIPLDGAGIEPVHFMKIDVEGWELDVIRGAGETITRDRPIMYVENDRPQNTEELMHMLMLLDYVSFDHQPKLCSPDNFKKRRVGRHENIISINALCIPNERATEVAQTIFR